MRPCELIRKESGFVHYYEIPRTTRNDFCAGISSSARKSGGLIRTEIVNAFDAKHNPVYLVRVTVVSPARPLEKRGRKRK